MLTVNNLIGFGASGGVIDQYTKLLLHCDGADASTTFTDSGVTGHTVTANGNAQVDTGQSVFGGASAQFDGNGDYLSIADHADWDFGTGDLTVDWWERVTGYSGKSAWEIGNWSTNTGILVEYASITGTRHVYVNGGSSKLSGMAAPSGAWEHCALVRSGNTWTFYIGGTSAGNFAYSGSVNTSNGIRIGTSIYNVSRYMTGHIDEFRISKGIARWTANFTPPTQPYPFD